MGFGNKLIKEVQAYKFLGLQIDNNFNWKKPINIYIYIYMVCIYFQNQVLRALSWG
jgi:hypothetical protein